ncbi:MAG: hypothetical protein FWB99_07840 [Treponema sp.]|nr:hypothetical protein [Treponema sp.]
MFRITQNISIPGLNQSMTQGRRMSLPVDPAFLVYSHFEHVYGRAAPQGTQGVAISQLKILDVLIRRLSQISGEAPPPLLAEPDENPHAVIEPPISPEAQREALQQIEALSPQMEALIENYRAQILQGMEASAAMPYLPAPNVQGGAVFSLVA